METLIITDRPFPLTLLCPVLGETAQDSAVSQFSDDSFVKQRCSLCSSKNDVKLFLHNLQKYLLYLRKIKLICNILTMKYEFFAYKLKHFENIDRAPQICTGENRANL